MPKEIYVGCALAVAPEEYKVEIDQLKSELTGRGYGVLEFVGTVNGTPEEVYTHDTDCAMKADLLVAECSYPSTGLGVEIGLRIAADKPILAVAKEGVKVSRLIQGVTHPGFSFNWYSNISEVPDLVDEKMVKLDDENKD